MPFFAQTIIDDVEKACKIQYITKADCVAWNGRRLEGELRLLTGWAWSAKNGSAYQQGFKTYSAAVRDAHYVLVEGVKAPFLPHRPRLVRPKKAAA